MQSPRQQQGLLFAADSLGSSAEQLAGRTRRRLSRGLSAVFARSDPSAPWPSSEPPPEQAFPRSPDVRLMRPHANLQLHCTPELLLVQPCDAPDAHPDSAWLCVDRAAAQLGLRAAPAARAAVASAAAGSAREYSTERVYGVIGVLRLLAGPYLALISAVEPVGCVLGCKVFQVVGVRLLSFTAADDLGLSADQLRSERQYAAEMQAWLQSGAFFFSHCLDLTRPLQDVLRPPTRAPALAVEGAGGQRAPQAQPEPLWRRTDRRFFFNWHASRELTEAGLHAWALPLIQGYVQVVQLAGAQLRTAQPAPPPPHATPEQAAPTAGGEEDAVLQLVLIARRSRLRAGQRFHTRGADGRGHVGNFVESEQLLLLARRQPPPPPAAAAASPGAPGWAVRCCSYTQVRGSIPLLWQQPTSLFGRNGGPVRFATSVLESLPALQAHVRELVRCYGRVLLLNLAGQAGSEGELTDAFHKLAHIAAVAGSTYVGFDWHKETRAGQQADALRKLLAELGAELDAIGDFAADATVAPAAPDDGGASGALGGLAGVRVVRSQAGVVRTNCIDCLDRTNQLQTALARRALERALRLVGLLAPAQPAVGAPGVAAAEPALGALPALESAFKELWANHGDAIAMQYTGTGALKNDVTRSGHRTLGGLLTDGRSSVLRYFVNNFRDGARQDIVDVCVPRGRSARARLRCAARALSRSLVRAAHVRSCASSSPLPPFLPGIPRRCARSFTGQLELDLVAHSLQTRSPLTQVQTARLPLPEGGGAAGTPSRTLARQGSAEAASAATDAQGQPAARCAHAAAPAAEQWSADRSVNDASLSGLLPSPSASAAHARGAGGGAGEAGGGGSAVPGGSEGRGRGGAAAASAAGCPVEEAEGDTAGGHEMVRISVFGVQLIGGSGGDTRDAYIKLDQQRGVVTTWTMGGFKRRLPVHSLLAAERSTADRRRLRLKFSPGIQSFIDLLCPSAPLRELLVALLHTLQAQSAGAPLKGLAPSPPARRERGAVARRLAILCATVDCAAVRPSARGAAAAAAAAVADDGGIGARADAAGEEDEDEAARCAAAVASVASRVRGEGVVVVACFNCPLAECEWARMLLHALAPSYSLFASTAVGSGCGAAGGLRLCGFVSAEHVSGLCSIETAARALPAAAARSAPAMPHDAHAADAGSPSGRGLACLTLRLGLSSFCFVACHLRPAAPPSQPAAATAGGSASASAGQHEESVARELLEGVQVGEERLAWHAQYHHALILGDTGLPPPPPTRADVSGQAQPEARGADGDGLAAEGQARAQAPQLLDGFRRLAMVVGGAPRGEVADEEGDDAAAALRARPLSLPTVHELQVRSVLSMRPHILAGAEPPYAAQLPAARVRTPAASREGAHEAEDERSAVSSPARALQPPLPPVPGVACSRIEVACFHAPMHPEPDSEPEQPSPLVVRLSLLRWCPAAGARAQRRGDVALACAIMCARCSGPECACAICSRLPQGRAPSSPGWPVRATRAPALLCRAARRTPFAVNGRPLRVRAAPASRAAFGLACGLAPRLRCVRRESRRCWRPEAQLALCPRARVHRHYLCAIHRQRYCGRCCHRRRARARACAAFAAARWRECRQPLRWSHAC